MSDIDPQPARYRVFLLSPAKASGRRAKQLASERATFDLAMRLRRKGAPLVEIFSFISGLYFRGKAAYSGAFSHAPAGLAGAYVITACGGLVPADRVLTLARLQRICAGDVHVENLRYLRPLQRDARKLAALAGANCEFVLLGSIATPKYVAPLLEIFGERLLFPADFVGRGDMSRGGLMLRSTRAGVELEYLSFATAVRHGDRPPRLPKLPRIQRTMAAAAGA
ncbi:MAG TPA: hypothetical protein VFO34_00380 [Candidatus Acidoferrales bacterium]|nr:hypothetical protein [Candidatus Acidoferrales bacterium]